MSDLTFWACVRFSVQLMLSGAALTFYLPRRKHFAGRILAGAAGYVILVLGIFYGLRSMFGDIMAGEVLYYLLLFLAGLALVDLCFEVSEKELIFIGTGAYAIQHMTFNLVQLTYYIPVLGDVLRESVLWNNVLPYMVMPVLAYLSLIRNFREKGELKEKDGRMILLALATIFVTIVVSLNARRAGGTPSQELVYYIYGAVCCILALVILM